MRSDQLKLMFVGDVVPGDLISKDGRYQFDKVLPYLQEGDLRCCQLETCISDRGKPRRDVLTPFIRSSKTVEGLKHAGFDVITFGGNNQLDFGEEAFLDTLDILKENEIQVVGAGRNLSEANKHVVVEKNGVRIAFVDRCTLLRQGYEAMEDRPGIAPLEAYTHYEPLENIREQPGTPSRTITVPDYNQLVELKNEIKKADNNADVVIASFHWGVHFCHDLSTLQPDLAYEAIDAGADIVIGTHPHVLQAIDVYKGRPIFYSLGNFAFSPINPSSPWYKWRTSGGQTYRSYYYMGDYPYDINSIKPRKAWRQSILVICDVTQNGINKVSFRPSLTNEQGIPSIINLDEKEGDTILKLLTRLSKMCGTNFKIEKDKVTIDLDQAEEIDVRKIIWARKQSYPSLCWIT
jgi:poly-gamma-glutamate synthesis protein (capsule biosynthesis protein)